VNRHALTFAVVCVAAAAASAQDTAVAAPRGLPTDSARVTPYQRSYEMLVEDGDSTVLIGQRTVTLTAATYNGDSAWLLTETRTGIVPAAESLFLARTLRPLHWSAVVGAGHLAAEFVGDSIYGATSGPAGKHNIVMQREPDLLVSAAMVEAVLAALPLAMDFHDSVTVLDVSLAVSRTTPAEIAVVGEEDLQESNGARPCWVVALREDQRQALYWVEKASGITLQMQQPLPAHVGRRLDYRFIDESGGTSP
jgi:hypothetical protein